MAMSRRKTRPVSWLTAVQTASAAFTGEARLVEDKWIPATETTFRGAGYRLTAEIASRRSLFGPLPESTVRLQGTTKRAPNQRLNLGAPRFPPDALRQEAYWEYALPGVIQPVLVIPTDPAVVRPLTGSDDELPDTVIIIHRWTNLARAEQWSTVFADLGKPGRSAVSYAAGFELLLKTTSDLPGLVDSFLSLPGRPGAATQEVLSQLYAIAMSLPQAEAAALARQLLVHWTKEVEPAALLGYLTWFDAHRRVWGDDPKLKTAVLLEAKRSVALSFSGPNALAWQQRVQQQGAFLLTSGNNSA
jgi:hypothetical protein